MTATSLLWSLCLKYQKSKESRYEKCCPFNRCQNRQFSNRTRIVCTLNTDQSLKKLFLILVRSILNLWRLTDRRDKETADNHSSLASVQSVCNALVLVEWRTTSNGFSVARSWLGSTATFIKIHGHFGTSHRHPSKKLPQLKISGYNKNKT